MKTTILAGILGVIVGCGGGSVERADIEPGAMPEGGDFTGVWFSPQYGEMHLRQTGAAVIGEYTQDERSGTIQGTVQGNLLRYEWREQRELVAGRARETRGRGYFQMQNDENGDYVVVGEWGHDNSEVGGGPWRAVKSRTRRPQLSTDSAGGDSASSSEGSYDESYDNSAPSQDETTGGGSDLEGLDGLDL